MWLASTLLGCPGGSIDHRSAASGVPRDPRPRDGIVKDASFWIHWPKFLLWCAPRHLEWWQIRAKAVQNLECARVIVSRVWLALDWYQNVLQFGLQLHSKNICNPSLVTLLSRLAFELLLVVLVVQYQAIPERSPVVPVPGETDCDHWEWDCSIPVSFSSSGKSSLSTPLKALIWHA